jgi:hypothetical protein
VATLLAIVSFVLATYVTFRQTEYINCIADRQAVSDKRTAEIAKATDAERRAQRRLIANTTPADTLRLKAEALAAYDVTDQVRAAHPPFPPGRC